MLNMVKKIAKALKGITRPHNAKPAVSYRNVPAKVLVMSNREELLTRMVGTLQATVEAKIKAFTDAVEAYPIFNYDVDDSPETETANLIIAAKALGFDISCRWALEYAALCAAIEYHQQQGEEITIKLIADVVMAIDYGKYTFFPNVEYDEDLGGEILDAFQNSGKHYERDRLGWLIEVVDCEMLGERWRNEEGGIYTTRGYFQFGKLEF